MPYPFTFTPEIVRGLQVIERARAEVNLTILPPGVAESLRRQARLRSSHFSTRIEGNRLSLLEAEQVIEGNRVFTGREWDSLEVKRYFLALAQVEKWIAHGDPTNEERIRRLHAIVFSGVRARPSLYRDGQNVIRDQMGGIVYLPPEATDVPRLMAELVDWLHASENDLPVPVVAGVVHYQFVTIHPFFDGNGRTARALAAWILNRGGYDLGGFIALEEFYANDLPGYYAALETHPHHNYYEGREQADITGWIAYFVKGMASAFTMTAVEVRRSILPVDLESESLLRRLDRRGRMVLGLFTKQDEITSRDVAGVLGLSTRQSRDLINEWIRQGWIQVSQAARKTRRYHLSAEYRRFIGDITAVL